MAVLWSLLIVMALSGFTLLSITLAQGSSIEASTRVRRAQANSLAQGVLAHAADAIYTALSTEEVVPTAGSITIDGTQVAWTVELLEGPIEGTDTSGLRSYDTVYGIRSTCQVDGISGDARQVVNARQVPLFQYAMFYENDMHFTWPAPMQVNGPVHCNAGVYFANWQDLTFNTNSFTATDGVHLKTKFDEWEPSWLYSYQNHVKIRKWVDDPTDPNEPVEYGLLQPERVLDNAGVPNGSGYDSSFAGYDWDGNGDYEGVNDWKPFGPGVQEITGTPDFYAGTGNDYTVKTAEHGATPVTLPPESSMEMFVAESGGSYAWDPTASEYILVGAGNGTHDMGSYHAQAGLSILSKPDGTWSAHDADGVDLTAAIRSAVTTGSMYDARQASGSGASIQMTTIDVDALIATGYFPKNGVIYTAAYGSGTGTNVRGFQLTNGATLSQDASFVSPDSLYVHGDFNTTDPKNASVMADAVNLLSNAWDDTKTAGTLPTASDTTYNMAIYTGDTEGTADKLNGGPHNLVRFHESWKDKYCNIKGSMVCSKHSTNATGDFQVQGDYYYPPIRNWSFDDRLRELENQPPGTPQFVSLVNVVSW